MTTLPLPEYDDLDGIGLAEGIAAGDYSPAEVVDAAIARIEARDPAVHALVYEQFEEARSSLESLPDGPFRGVPMLLKDLAAEQRGHPSTQSCRALSTWRAKADATLVQRFQRAGAVILGRTNTPEFGIMGTTEPLWRGPTHNPWDLERSAGGSSGGSGAAVAARMVPLAHGGDGGGSIRIPASHNGLFGLKPTSGRNPIGPWVSRLWGGLVAEHVLTRSVRDSAGMLDALSGPELGAPLGPLPPARPFLSEVGTPPGTLRIAWTAGALYGKDTHKECVAAVQDAASLAAALGHTVEEATPAVDRQVLVRAYLLEVAAGTAATLRGIGRKLGRPVRRAEVEAPSWLFASIGEAITAADLEESRELAHLELRRVAEFFTRYDVLLTPTVADLPVRLGELAVSAGQQLLIGALGTLRSRALLLKALDSLAEDSLAKTPNTMLFNQTGQPAMSVPTWWSEGGLPVGTQWVGRFGDEATLLRLASQLEDARPWRDRRPALLQG
ncbi:MAG: amidase [Deltaproteobacteria bacterium]|nr:amidase [Deltaproteobacteria bacterium]